MLFEPIFCSRAILERSILKKTTWSPVWISYPPRPMNHTVGVRLREAGDRDRVVGGAQIKNQHKKQATAWLQHRRHDHLACARTAPRSKSRLQDQDINTSSIIYRRVSTTYHRRVLLIPASVIYVHKRSFWSQHIRDAFRSDASVISHDRRGSISRH